MSKLTLSIFIIIMIFANQSALAAVHLDPKAIKKPDDLTYKVDTTGNTLVWQYEAEESADFPGTYTVSKDNTVLVDHDGVAWQDKTDIVVNVDGLAIGVYTYKIEVTDLDSNDNPALTSTDTAIVTVVAELVTTSTTELVATSTPDISSTESDASVLLVPVIAMLLAMAIGVPALKYKDFRK